MSSQFLGALTGSGNHQHFLYGSFNLSQKLFHPRLPFFSFLRFKSPYQRISSDSVLSLSGRFEKHQQLFTSLSCLEHFSLSWPIFYNTSPKSWFDYVYLNWIKTFPVYCLISYICVLMLSPSFLQVNLRRLIRCQICPVTSAFSSVVYHYIESKSSLLRN